MELPDNKSFKSFRRVKKALVFLLVFTFVTACAIGLGPVAYAWFSTHKEIVLVEATWMTFSTPTLEVDIYGSSGEIHGAFYGQISVTMTAGALNPGEGRDSWVIPYECSGRDGEVLSGEFTLDLSGDFSHEFSVAVNEGRGFLAFGYLPHGDESGIAYSFSVSQASEEFWDCSPNFSSVFSDRAGEPVAVYEAEGEHDGGNDAVEVVLLSGMDCFLDKIVFDYNSIGDPGEPAEEPAEEPGEEPGEEPEEEPDEPEEPEGEPDEPEEPGEPEDEPDEPEEPGEPEDEPDEPEEPGEPEDEPEEPGEPDEEPEEPEDE